MSSEILLKLNVGCGHSKWEGFINIDTDAALDPDLVLDIRTQSLPYGTNTIDEIYFIHSIEHVEKKFHFRILEEFNRALKVEGLLCIAYPEFLRCAENYSKNFLGQREFWEHTIYGLQRTPSDFHVSLMDTTTFIPILYQAGFYNICAAPERDESYNTFLTCRKAESKPGTRADVLNQEIFRK